MNDARLSNKGHILAEFTRSLGMMAENMQRQQLKESMAYVDKDFESMARQIEYYAEQLR